MCEGVCVDGAMILVSGSSGFRSRRTMRNQQPIRERPNSKAELREAVHEVMTTKL